MQDKEIRKILIEYLKIQHEDHRIYQEKNIGTAVCDVMLVTDHLSGFEIKSDCDNYERLPRQVHAYDLMFDKNYIAVGVSHINSIKTKVPTHWGILAVDSSGIRSIREAKRNKSVKRTHQLNLLWKLELKNLLLKNQLPVYAQKSKAFLRDVISREVPTDTLGPQIATELLNRDESLFDEAEAKTADNAEGYLEKELADYLSEEDLESFTLDKWMAVYRRAVDTRIRKKAREQQITQEHRDSQRAAHTISYTDIKASLGVPWVSAEIISQFAIEVLNVKQQYYYRRDEILGKSVPYKKVPIVQYEKITGYWHVEKYKKQQSPEFTMKYGTARYNAMQILESTLNLRQIRVYDGNAYNEAETLAVLEKQKALQDAFEQWVWRDEDRRWEIEDAYNRLFAEYNVHTFDGSKLKFPGMNPEIKLYDYQKDAVQKIISTPNTLLSFDVGSGKTYIMIAAAMEMRKSGLSRKNIFVVPNNIVGQWEKMFCDLYAQVKALALSEPLMKEYTEKENELRRTRMVLQQEMEQKAEAKTQISVLEGQIKSLRQQLVQTEATALYVAEHIDLLCKEIVRAADWITSEDSGREPYFLGEFTLQILKDSTENISAVLSRGGVNYTLDLGHSFAGNKTRFKNFFLKFPAQADNLRKQIEDMEARKSDLKQQVKYVSQSSDRITLLEQELKAIFVKISQKAG